jgi:hypothetical protein
LADLILRGRPNPTLPPAHRIFVHTTEEDNDLFAE